MGEPAASDLQPITDNNYQLPKVLAEMIIILIQPAWKKVEKSAKKCVLFQNACYNLIMVEQNMKGC